MVSCFKGVSLVVSSIYYVITLQITRSRAADSQSGSQCINITCGCSIIMDFDVCGEKLTSSCFSQNIHHIIILLHCLDVPLFGLRRIPPAEQSNTYRILIQLELFIVPSSFSRHSESSKLCGILSIPWSNVTEIAIREELRRPQPCDVDKV